MKSIFRICIPAAGLLAATAIAAAQQRYSVIDLKPLPGGTFSLAGINNTGLAGGLSTTSDGSQHAVLWPAGSTTPIDVGPNGVNSGIFALNERGQAAVQSEIGYQDPYNENFCGYGAGRKCQPFLLQSSGLTPLPLLGGNNGTVGGINSRGEISGWAETATLDADCPAPQKLDFEAIVWGPRPADFRRLPPLIGEGDTVSMSLWINDAGEAVGTSGTCANTGLFPLGHGAHPVLWDRTGSALDIGKTNPAEEFGGIALGINNAGQVVGAGTFPDGSQMAFLWSRQAPLRKLVPLPGDVVSGAVSINERGDAVGQSFSSDGFPSPVLWQNGGMPTNLNDLAPGSPLFLLWPTSINGRGEISGFGVTAEGDVHGFLAIPNGALSLNNTGSTRMTETRRPALSEKVRSVIRSRFGGLGR